MTPAQTAQHEALVEAARRHGMSVPEYQFYGDLIERLPSAQQALAGATITIVNNDGAGEGFNSAARVFCNQYRQSFLERSECPQRFRVREHRTR